MSETSTDSRQEASAETLLVACPVDASVNRVPRERLDRNPKCGRCHNPLFAGTVVELSAANFDAHTLKSDLPVVIDFWAEWCGPCRMMSPSFEKAAPRLEPRVRLGKLNTEAEPAIAGRYGIRSIPSLIMISRGQEIARTAGAMPTSAIVEWVEQALKKA